MLFNSFEFIFLFLPVALCGFFFAGRFGGRTAGTVWLTLLSLFFYAYWDPRYLLLLGASILGNYTVGYALAVRPSKGLLALGITINLALLAYYKYANFFLDNLNALAHLDWNLGQIILPLGISFFTFTQIAYLVDVYRGLAQERNFTAYCLFVTFFPHLIAGPILHHKEMMSQFVREEILRPDARNIAVGATIFAIGLFKKVVFADNVSAYVGPVFTPGANLTFLDAWIGALAYTMQLYFDFSGYSDMAVGLSLLFNIRLPVNFYSPYQSTSIVEFWRRWHMTLSRYLRDYLYIALGGNRKGLARRYVNLMTTMLLGGLWHGAGWTFVIWGGLHGSYLCINHAWTAWRGSDKQASGLSAYWGVVPTFLAVVIGWVFFRAPNVGTALDVLGAMGGAHGFLSPASGGTIALRHLSLPVALVTITSLMAIAFLMPNTMKLTRHEAPALGLDELADDWRDSSAPSWRPTPLWAGAVITILVVAIASMSQVSEFLYFQF